MLGSKRNHNSIGNLLLNIICELLRIMVTIYIMHTTKWKKCVVLVPTRQKTNQLSNGHVLRYWIHIIVNIKVGRSAKTRFRYSPGSVKPFPWWFIMYIVPRLVLTCLYHIWPHAETTCCLQVILWLMYWLFSNELRYILIIQWFM